VCRLTRQEKTSKVTLGHWPRMNIERARKARDRLTGSDLDLPVSAMNQGMVTVKQRSNFVSRIALLPAIPHRCLLFFGIDLSSSTFHGQHPPLHK
jgi:hypothetical protein